jgi:hypothetical protein
MRRGEPRNPPPGQSADHARSARASGNTAPKPAAKSVRARALPAPGYLRRRQECSGRGLAAPARAQVTGRMLRRGVSHAGR